MYRLKKYFSGGLLVLIAVFFIYTLVSLYLSYKEIDTDIASLRFSNTQSWDSTVYDFINHDQFILDADDYRSISIPPPTSNTAPETQAELTLLHEVATLRDKETQAAILRQLEIKNASLGPVNLSEVMNDQLFPETNVLISEPLTEISKLVVEKKQMYDRVRPSVLDTTLTTTIPVPGHPAYPSGHASQFMLIAHILSDLDPGNSDTYQTAARQIAFNREIAGVHYRSDSIAGESLANQYFALLRETSWYQNQLKQARQEW